MHRSGLEKSSTPSSMCSSCAIVWENTLTEDLPQYFLSIWKVLRVLKRLDRMGDAIETVLVARSQNTMNAMNSSLIKFGLRFLETVAWTSNHHMVACRIFFMYKVYMPQHHSRLRQWNPKVWEHLHLQIIKDWKSPVSLLWEVLEMDMYENPPEDTSRLLNQHHGYYGDRRAEIVRKALPSFLKVPHLTDRVAFRHISQGILFLERHRSGVTPDDIWVLYTSVVRRHLREGRPGQSARLDWLVEVIRRNFGMDVAVKSRKTLLFWRREVKDKIAREAKLMNGPVNLEPGERQQYLGEAGTCEGTGRGEQD